MTSHPLVPQTLVDLLSGVPSEGGPDGSTWLRSLPGILDAVVAAWDLRPVGPPMNGWTAVVVPVERDGVPMALKVGWPHDEAATEHLALRHWAGNGAARLHAADPTRGALLLEMLDSTHDLGALDIDTACATAGGLLARLHVAPPPTVPRLTEVLERWLEPLRERPASLPRQAVGRALGLFDSLAPTPESSARLLHGDLHFTNVLAAEREPWLAIDPKPMAGHPGWDLQPLLRNRVEEYGTGSTLRWQVRRRAEVAAEAAGIDWDLARSWTIVHSVLQAFWAGRGDAPEETSLHLSIAKAMGD